MENFRQVRAKFDESTITVYQAFNKSIADLALSNQTFVSPPFKKERMTWIKPSFLWTMYRSGWASKENQEHILAIKIKRQGFEWALENSCLTHFDSQLYSSYAEWKNQLSESLVRIQWDPERDIFSQCLSYRSIQVGLSGIGVEKYISDWIVEIEDVTDYCEKIKKIVAENYIELANSLIPNERVYPLTPNIAQRISLS